MERTAVRPVRHPEAHHGGGDTSDTPGRRTPPMIPHSAAEVRRGRQLSLAKRRATALLIGVTVVFVATVVPARPAPWVAWVQATAVASMVGGLADWFAVTALFRRPLGLPIPHTAIVVERKQQFAETLGSFVQESFLTPDAVNERLRIAGAVPRLAAWLADGAHAADAATHVTGLLVTGADLLHDEDVHMLLVTLGRQRLERVALAPLAGRALEEVIRDGRHNPMVDVALRGLGVYLERHGPELHARLGVRSPWWLPAPVEERMVDLLLDQSRRVIGEMALDRDHPLRRQLDEGLVHLATELQTSPDLRERGEALKAELLGQSQLRDFAGTLWRDTKAQLREQASRPGSELRVRMAAVVTAAGVRLRDDPEVQASAARSLERVVVVVLGRFDSELGRLVSGTIDRWDASETSRRLELLLGPDLQYIRINGTVVGAAAGLAIHAFSRLVG